MTDRLTALDLVASARRLLREAAESQSWLRRQECEEQVDRRLEELQKVLRESAA